MSPVDPHSFTDSSEPFSTHIALNLFLDFSSSTIIGSALISLPTSYSGNLTLDSRAISISAVIDPDSLSPLPFAISSSADPIKGSPITIALSSHSSVLIVFSTSPSSSALQWLSPAQTSSGSHPFVYTQCQSIHARSVFPCQDTPAARIRYSARINLPLPLSAVMSASKLARRDPIAGEGSPGVPDSLWCSKDRIVECFSMDQPIPPYLFALAAGEISGRDLGPRTRVYAEGGPEVLDAAAREFSGVEEMVRVGEALFGPYEWERFDVLVLPPSFPYGGMENPRMVFLTPTVIKGDATGAQVVIHELAHSWTGNLITNKTNEDFWLNESFARFCMQKYMEKCGFSGA
ncbi:leucine aminopeptidase isoform X2 [Dendrobium catenatum]|uniref:leucine aminopeptidase isoform X2 n=1 Tax=Dendrobium catenatum TaxID=906689 RepID=UPI00109F34B1|nr:leucine aminopeptidase isoform X2 [Dendrobium catenatum]